MSRRIIRCLALATAVLMTAAARTAPVLGGAVLVGLPDGYCIDRNASREGGDAAVVVMGRCSSASAPEPAILAVSVGGAGSASVLRGGGATLAGFFASDKGRAMLARSGKAADVQVLRISEAEGAFYLRLRDRRLGEYWRAVTGVRGRLVSISATAAPGQALVPETGRTLVQEAVRSVRKANAAPG